MSLGGLTGGGVVGSARVLVVPDAAGFDAALKRQIEGTVGRQGVTIPIAGDTRGADAAVAGVSTRASRTRSSVKVDADTRQAEEKVKGLTAKFGDVLSGVRGLSPLGGGIFFRSAAVLDRDVDASTKLAGAFLAVGAAGTVAIRSASNLEEQQNKVNVVFGQGAGEVDAFADKAATGLGLSERAALEASGTFGNLFRSIGLAQPVSAEMSTSLVKLAADLASFNNIAPEDALLKLRSGIVGEIEPLRTLGVTFDEAEVKAKGLALGLAGPHEELTQGEKVQARYALIMEKTALAQGDFGRTSGSLANQQRQFHAVVENLSAQLGRSLIPALTETAKGFNFAAGGLDKLGIGTKPLIDIALLSLGASAMVKLLNGAIIDEAASAGGAVLANSALATSEVAVGASAAEAVPGVAALGTTAAAAGGAGGVGLLAGAVKAFIPAALLLGTLKLGDIVADFLNIKGQLGDLVDVGQNSFIGLERRIPLVGGLLAGLDEKILGAGRSVDSFGSKGQGALQAIGALSGQVEGDVSKIPEAFGEAGDQLEPFREAVRRMGEDTEGPEKLEEAANKLKDRLDELGAAVGVNGTVLLGWANGDAKEAEREANAVASAMQKASQAFLGDFSVTATFSGSNIAKDAREAEQANERLADSQRALGEVRQRYGDAQRDAAERALDAEVRLADAQENAAESVLGAERKLADSHTHVAELRESQALEAQQEEEQYAQKVEDVNRRILDAEENLSQQRVSLNEAVRDAEDRLQQTRDAGSRRVGDAEQRLADLLQRRSAGGNPEMEREISAQQELRRARQSVEEARREAAENEQRDIAAVEKARRRETEGIRDAEEQVTEARKAGLDLVREAEQITRNQVQRQREMEKAVADVGEAEKALNEARRDGARSVADAEKGITEAREEGTRAIAKAAEAVAEAQRKVGDAAAEVNSEIRLTTRLLEGSSAAADLNAFIWSKFGAVVDPLTDARMALRALLEEAGNLSPVQKKIVNFYQDSLIAGKVFSENIRTAIKQGYDPALIAQILSDGPKEAGPILQELVNEHTGRLRDFVNAAEDAIRDQSAMVVEMTRLTNIAVNAQNDQTAKDLQLAYGIMQQEALAGGTLTVEQLAKGLGAKKEDVERTVAEYGITVTRGVDAINQAVGVTAPQVAQALNFFGAKLAEGGMLPRDSGFRNSGTIVQWAEPETGGEYHAFIPKANDHRRRNALDTLSQAAGDLDHAIVPRSVLDGLNGFFAPEFQAFAVGGKTAGLNADFLRRLEDWSETVPGRFLNITSGFRSREEQAELYRRYQAGTGNLAAPPGSSKHELGLAADHYPNGWDLARTANPFGIIHPVSSESWHAEPSGTVAGGVAGAPSPLAHTELPPVPDMNWAGWGFGGSSYQAMAYERRIAQDFINTREAEENARRAAAAVGGAGPAVVGGDIDAWINEAIRITGAPQSWFDGIKARAMQESGGRNIPQAINDVNTQRGTPAFGPMQVIEPTFRAYAEPGYEDWHNPVHNIAAAINYITAKYGDPYHLPRGGYAKGGILSFAGGGTVPGALGAPQLAVVHGGEVISDPTVPRTRVEASNTVNLTLNVPVSVSGGTGGASVAQEIEDAILRSNLLDRAAEKINRAMLNQRRKVGGAT